MRGAGPPGWRASDEPWLGLFLQLHFLLFLKKTLGLDVSWGCGKRHSQSGPFSNEDAREGFHLISPGLGRRPQQKDPAKRDKKTG